MRRLLALLFLALLVVPRMALADAAPPPADPGIPIESIRTLFLIFAAVVLLFIGIKWLFLWRRLYQPPRAPRPTPPPDDDPA